MKINIKGVTMKTFRIYHSLSPLPPDVPRFFVDACPFGETFGSLLYDSSEVDHIRDFCSPSCAKAVFLRFGGDLFADFVFSRSRF